MYVFSKGELSLDHIFFAVKTTKMYHNSRGRCETLLCTIPQHGWKIFFIERLTDLYATFRFSRQFFGSICKLYVFNSNRFNYYGQVKTIQKRFCGQNYLLRF